MARNEYTKERLLKDFYDGIVERFNIIAGYVYVCMYICMCICVYMYVCICICMYVCMTVVSLSQLKINVLGAGTELIFVLGYVYVCMYICMCICVCMYVCIYVYMYV